jgi:hypothetical protein
VGAVAGGQGDAAAVIEGQGGRGREIEQAEGKLAAGGGCAVHRQLVLTGRQGEDTEVAGGRAGAAIVAIVETPIGDLFAARSGQ